MRSTLQQIRDCGSLELGIVATGMHLDEAYGATEQDILAAGLPVTERVPVEGGAPDGALMAANIGRMLMGFVDALQRLKPDIVLLLGDRGEMLAGALASIHLNIATVHLHGGERSGTVDEPVRHAISKLAYFHCVSTEQSRERLCRMGELASNISVVGAPGLDGLQDESVGNVAEILRQNGLADDRFALLLYHPTPEEIEWATDGLASVVDSLTSSGLQVLALKPNSDAGSASVLAALESMRDRSGVSLVTHLRRSNYITLLRHADLLVGNSSSGIIEAASFGTPVVNIGIRQQSRERNINTVDAEASSEAVTEAIAAALTVGRHRPCNVYGDGNAGKRIVDLLCNLKLPSTVAKFNSY